MQPHPNRLMQQQRRVPPPTAGRKAASSRRQHWSRRRRIAFVLVALIILTPIAAGAWYANNISNAIGDAQSAAVVDLPERGDAEGAGDGEFQSGNSGTPVDNAIAQAPTRKSPEEPSAMDVARGLYSAGSGGEETSPAKTWPDKRFLTILVLGVDTRGDGGDQNADTIIIARLDLQTGALNSVSIPRDLLVNIPGYGEGKINGAYGIGLEENPDSRVGGVAKMRDTVEANFGVVIDEYVMIDFEGFEKVVDSVGGIDINVPERIEDPAYPTEDYGVTTFIVESGRQHMDGVTALAYARTRNTDSDDQRRERQMLVIEALLNEGQQLGTITRVAGIIQAVGGAAQTSLHWNEQLALASIAFEVDESRINMVNLEPPLIEPGTSETGAWVYQGDIPAIAAFIESTLTGEPLPGS